MNKKSKTNLKRTLSVFLTLLMLLSTWVFVAPSAAAQVTEENAPLLGRFFSTDNWQYDAVSKTDVVTKVSGSDPSYDSGTGFTVLPGDGYLQVSKSDLYAGVSEDTGLSFAFTYYSSKDEPHEHLISSGASAYGSGTARHYYIAGTYLGSNTQTRPLFMEWIGPGGDSQKTIRCYADGLTFQANTTYDVVVSISVNEGVVYTVNGKRYAAFYIDSSFADQKENIRSFLNDIADYQYHYIGRSRWSADGLFAGAVKDMRLYSANLLSSALLGRFFSTSNVWYDAATDDNSGLISAGGPEPAYNGSTGFTTLSTDNYLQVADPGLFAGVTPDTGLTLSFSYRPTQNAPYVQLLSFGREAYGSGQSSHFYIGATYHESYHDNVVNRNPLVFEWRNDNNTSEVVTYPVGLGFEPNATYDVEIAISAAEGVVYKVNGQKYNTAYHTGSKANISSFLNAVSGYKIGYIGRSRWNDPQFAGDIKDLRLYKTVTSSAPLLGRYFSTSNVWYDAVTGNTSGLTWGAGQNPSYNASTGFTYLDGQTNNSYVSITNTAVFSGVNADTGLSLAFTYQPTKDRVYNQLFSFGYDTYGNGTTRHLYIGATHHETLGSNTTPLYLDWMDNSGNPHIRTTPQGLAFENNKVYDVIISISATEGVVYKVNGNIYPTDYNGSSFENEKQYIVAMLNDFPNYQNNYIGRSRWTGDESFTGNIKDLRLYGCALMDKQALIDKSAPLFGNADFGFDSATLEARLTQSSDANKFTASAWHYDDLATGGFRNLVYSSPQGGTYTYIGNEIEAGGTKYKVFSPAQAVMVRTAPGSTYFPVQIETHRKDGTVWDNSIRYIASNNANYDLLQDWTQTLDNNYSNGWEHWAGTTSNFGPRTISSVNTRESNNDDKNDTSRFAWNAVRYTGNPVTFYYDWFTAIDFDTRAYCAWTGSSGTSNGSVLSNTGVGYYAINYQPVYDVLPNALACYNEIMENGWMYTEESLNRAKATIVQLAASNPNNPAYTYASDASMATAECGVNIIGAMNLLGDYEGVAYTYEYEGLQLEKKTGTVIWQNYNGAELETDNNVIFGETPTFDQVAVPTKPQDTQYTYSFSGWSPEVGPVSADETVYTAQFTPVGRTYNVTSTGTFVVNFNATATFGTDYSAETDYTTPVPQTNTVLFQIAGVSGVKIGGAAYTGTYTVNADKSVTIPGAAITGDVEITYTTEGSYFPVTLSGDHVSSAPLADAQFQSTGTYTATLAAEEHYLLTDVTSVVIGSKTYAKGDTAFSYNPVSGVITISSDKINAPVTINAVAEKEQFSVTYSANLQNPAAQIGYGDVYETVLVPVTGSYLTGDDVVVTVGGTPLTKGTDYTYADGELTILEGKVTGAVSITATTDNTYTVTLGGDNVVAASDTAAYGEAYSITPAADVHYHITGIDSITVGGTALTAGTDYTVTPGTYAVTIPGSKITGAVVINALAAPDTFTVSVAGGSNVTSATYNDVPYGTDKVVPLAADAHYHITGVDTVTIGGADYALPAGAYDDTNKTVTIPGADITGNVVIIATAAIDTYTVIWLNEDSSEIDRTTVAWNVVPTHADPVKSNTAEYTYTFTGWNDGTNEYAKDALPAATADVTYKAVFSSNKNSYTITWLNEDNTEFDTTTVEYGQSPSHAGPSKTATAQYSYTFAGWSDATTDYAADAVLPAVTGPATYTARFTANLRSYEVTFLNEGGAELQSGTLEYGEVPAYAGEAPTKASTAQYSYTFAGWSDATTDYVADAVLPAVTGPVTYTARFTQNTRSYTITWVDGNNNELYHESVAYGETPAYAGAEPTKNSTAQYSYSFNNTWLPEITEVSADATYTAQFTQNTRSYTITWNYIDANGAPASTTTTVEYGQMPAAPAALSGLQYHNGAKTYTLSGWEEEFVPVAGEAAYTATYTETDRTVKATWNYTDAAGEQQTEETTVAYNTVPMPPVAVGYQTVSTVYTLTGWNDGTADYAADALPQITADAEFTAVYTDAVRTYTVTWVDGNSNELYHESVAYDDTPAYDGAEPTKTATAQYTYSFSGWNDGTNDYAVDAALPAVSGDVTYTAIFTPTLRSYTVTWENYDENVLDTDTNVAYGTVPAYDGEQPTKPGDGATTYNFTGWTVKGGDFYSKDSQLPAVEGDVTFVATFDSSAVTYNVTWKNYDDTVLATDEGLVYGATPTYSGETAPAREATAQYTYEFAGWSDGTNEYAADAVLPGVSANVTYTALFTAHLRSYTVIWKNVDGTELKTEQKDYGTVPAYTGETPVKDDAQYTYTFKGWTSGGSTYGLTDALPAVQGDVTFTAWYDTVTKTYTVIWKNYDETVLETDENVPYGTLPTYDGENDPAKEATAQYSYQFDGWDPVISSVKGNVTYTAVFTPVVRKYTVLWMNGDDIAETDTDVPYGTVPSFDSAQPTKDPQGDVTYTFDGWQSGDSTYAPGDAFPAIQGDTTFNAVFSEGVRLYTATFTDNLGNTYSESKASGTAISLAQPGYKLHTSSTANVGSFDFDAQTYTFASSETAAEVSVNYVLDVDALLTAAETILADEENYDSNYITSLRTAKNALETVCDDPAQLAQAAEYKETLQARVNEAASFSAYTVIFLYGKNGDVPAVVNDLHLGDTVNAPAASVTSYMSSGFSYPVSYWKDADNNKYTVNFPSVTGNATYTAVYTTYDLYDDLRTIRDAKAMENVTDATSIDAIEHVLSQIDALFAENGVVVSDYTIVQQNSVNKETAAGISFVQALSSLIAQLQSIANSADSICTGHEFDYFDQRMPSCTEPGYEAYKVCRLCNTKVGGAEIPATGHSATYDRDPVRSGALTDGTCAWDTYTCKNGCGDFYLIPTYIVRYTDDSTVAGATVTLFVDGQNISVVADNGGRANFRGRLAPGQLVEGQYDLTVSLGETAKTGSMLVHNGRVTINIARLEHSGQQGDNGDNGNNGSGGFRCPMCKAYDDLRTMPVVGWFVAIVHFFVHMAYRIINSSTAFSGKFTF